MLVEIGTRDELMVVLRAAVHLGEPARTVAVFRLDVCNGLAIRFEESTIATVAEDVELELWRGVGGSRFYFRPRQDELCLFLEGPLEPVGPALTTAVLQTNRHLELDGITVGFGTATVPGVPCSAIEALRAVDRRIIDTAGRPMRRRERADFLILRGAHPATEPREQRVADSTPVYA